MILYTMHQQIEYRYEPMDVDDAQPKAGPSRMNDIQMENEDPHGSEAGQDYSEQEVEEEAYVERLTFAHTSHTTSSRSTSVAQTSCAVDSPSASMLSGTPDSIDPYPYALMMKTLQTFKLLYIPDPSRENRNRDHVAHDLAWVKRNLTKDQLVAIKDMRGYYHKAKPTKEDLAAEGSTYRLTEWVSSPLAHVNMLLHDVNI
jgi:hypothetical protein